MTVMWGASCLHNVLYAAALNPISSAADLYLTQTSYNAIEMMGMVNTPVSAVMVHESPIPALDKGEGSFCVAIRHNVWTIMILGGGGRAWVLEGWWCVHGS